MRKFEVNFYHNQYQYREPIVKFLETEKEFYDLVEEMRSELKTEIASQWTPGVYWCDFHPEDMTKEEMDFYFSFRLKGKIVSECEKIHINI